MLSVKHSFSRSQLETLESVLQVVSLLPPTSAYGKLISILIQKQWKKVAIKSMDFKKKYSVSFDADVCLALYLVFMDQRISTTHASITLMSLIDKIKRTYNLN